MDVERLSREVIALDESAQRFGSPCGDGELVIRFWSCADPDAENVVLAHGGSGSWSHWYRTIPELRRTHNVYAVDLPGLGDSGALPAGYTARDAADAVVTGFNQLESLEQFHLVAFSWGCALSAQIARQFVGLKSLLLVGPAAVGDIPRRGNMKPLIKRTAEMSDAAIFAANRKNLARLMFYEAAKIDDMAVYLQTINTRRARFNSPQFARSTLVLDGLEGLDKPVLVLYGQFDAPGLPDISGKRILFEGAKPDIEFEVVPDAGHWLQYERDDVFNARCLSWISRNA